MLTYEATKRFPAAMNSTRQILERVVKESNLSLRAFARQYGNWSPAYLVRSLQGEKQIGPAVIGRLLVRLDAKTAAELVEAYLQEQRQLIETERQRFARLMASRSRNGSKAERTAHRIRDKTQAVAKT